MRGILRGALATLVLVSAARAESLEPQGVAGPAAAEAAAPAPEQPIEIVVAGERPAPSEKTLTRAEVRQIPGAFGDPLRAIDILPGVSPMVSGAPFFYLRGAPPGNLGYFLDGVRVPYLYHIGLGPSVVHPSIVERVDVYPGGYPASFGRFAGGIVAAGTTRPRTDFHGEGNVRLFDLGAAAETGFAGGRGTVLLGGRYSYTAALASLIVPEVKIDYRDFQARATYDLGPDDTLSVFSFGSYDLLGAVSNDIVTVFFGSEFYRADFRYDHRFSPDSKARLALTLGFDQTRIAEERNGQTKLVGSRLETQHRLDDAVDLEAGADFTFEAYGATSIKYDDPENPEVQKRDALFPERNDIAIGGYTELVVRATPEVELRPGLRADLFGSGPTTKVGIDPRLAARFRVSDQVRILHAYGIVHQPPSFIAPLPGLTPGTLDRGLQTGVQTSAGVEVDLPSEVTASATVFQNAFFKLSDAAGTSSDFEPASTDLQVSPDVRSTGWARGLEILVRRSLTRRLGGYLSYTLSRSMRSMGRERFPAAFDRTHVANAALGYDLGRRWRAGGRFLFYTGTPKRYPSAGLIVPPRPESPARSPAFYRLDVRLEKRWLLSETAWISMVAEVLNATLSKETFSAVGGGDQTIGPLTIPSIGAEAGF